MYRYDFSLTIFNECLMIGKVIIIGTMICLFDVLIGGHN